MNHAAYRFIEARRVEPTGIFAPGFSLRTHHVHEFSVVTSADP
jgi:hypothetical protein